MLVIIIGTAVLVVAKTVDREVEIRTEVRLGMIELEFWLSARDYWREDI